MARMLIIIMELGPSTALIDYKAVDRVSLLRLLYTLRLRNARYNENCFPRSISRYWLPGGIVNRG